MDTIITGFVDRMLVPFIESGGALLVFALLWALFAYGVVMRQGSLDDAWQTLRALPLAVQLVVWLLFLPVMAGLWIWESTWPLLLRITLVSGLGVWNLLIFLPKWLTSAPAK